MTPEQFLASKSALAPAYLFLGPEAYQRRLCRDALLSRALPGDRSSGLTQVDLEDTSLTDVLDDARSLSLFSSDRVIWVSSAELALPRRITETAESATGDSNSTAAALASYLRAPTPGTVLVLECSRYDFSGDDRPKLERVEKFYSGIPNTVEFRPFTPDAMRALAGKLAAQHGLRLTAPQLALLIDAVAGDANRLVAEFEKLSLFAAGQDQLTLDDLRSLVPNAAQSTIFALVNALGKRDRPGALRSLDILIREGEYLPLALTFLSTQFRLALAAKEANITSAQQGQSFFTRLGVRMWRERAEQVVATASAFTRDHLANAVRLIYETDKKFREGYRDDRVVMESLVFALTQGRSNI